MALQDGEPVDPTRPLQCLTRFLQIKQKELGDAEYHWFRLTICLLLAALRLADACCRGKGLGGSSGINFMCWTKPPREEIDGELATAFLPVLKFMYHSSTEFEKLGNPGWNWNNYERHLAKTEGYVRMERE